MSEFHETVLAFKRRAHEVHPDKGEDNDNGEWESGNEFDRMCDSFRDVVTYIASPKLSYYLDLADHSSLIYLKENAEAIRERLRQPK